MNQRRVVRELITELQSLYPQMSRIAEGLRKVLGEAQNAPPHGASDGSIDEEFYGQVRSVEKELWDILLVQLFVPPGRSDPTPEETPQVTTQVNQEVPQDILDLLP